MNHNRMLQPQLTEFPALETGFKRIAPAANLLQSSGELPSRDDINIISRKGRSKGYQDSASTWDETCLSLDVYLSLVDHGDFD